MSDIDQREGPDIGHVVAGCFLIVMSLGLLLAGGSCTVMILASPGTMGPASDWVPFLFMSLALLGAGVVAIWFGVRLLMGKYRG